jgi:hypothetical protein
MQAVLMGIKANINYLRVKNTKISIDNYYYYYYYYYLSVLFYTVCIYIIILIVDSYLGGT